MPKSYQIRIKKKHFERIENLQSDFRKILNDEYEKRKHKPLLFGGMKKTSPPTKIEILNTFFEDYGYKFEQEQRDKVIEIEKW